MGPRIVGGMTDLRALLRALPGFVPDLPVLDPDAAPHDPNALFSQWFEDALEQEDRQPHAMSFSTVRPDGTPVARTLILKDVDASGYQFSTHSTSRKGMELADDPRCTMLFWWRSAGRQVRITGTAHALDEAASQADWEARPSYTGRPNPDWQLYALQPEEFEFMQAREDRNHTRLEYRLEGGEWTHGLVPTPAG